MILCNKHSDLRKYKTTYNKEKMTPETQKKVEFILDWYNKEKVRFTFAKQIILCKSWVTICTKNEEYEMALALHKEMEKVIWKYLKIKRTNRTCRQKIRFYWVRFKRSFRK